jgi:cytochrome oxidase Cu insertion factor (SCO1/SenC/PrrC family)
MRIKMKTTAGLALLLALAATPSLSAVAQKTTRPALKVGDVAPDFTLDYFNGNDLKKVSLHDFKGKNNVMVGFYIFAFTGG